MTKLAYTVNELSHEIGIRRTRIYDLIKQGDLVPRKLGKRTIFLADDVQSFLDNLPKAA